MCKKELVCFVILHYNTIYETINCITSILELDNANDSRIIIVDNASPNKTGKMLVEKYSEYKNVDVLLMENNDGFSAGNNAGCAYAISKWNPDFLVVANNDIEFCQKDFITKIVDEYEKNPFAVLGPDIYAPVRGVHQSPMGKNPPDKKRVSRTIVLNQLVLWVYPVLYPVMRSYFRNMEIPVQAEEYSSYQENVCLMGACMVYSKKYMDARNKIFEPETKFYYEEYIQMLWCLKHKKKIIYQPGIMVYHMEGKATETVGARDKERIRFRMCNILQAARIYRDFLTGILK